MDEEINIAEREIKILRKGASERINKIAIETSSDLVKKLIGAEVNNSSISAIVNDLSKKAETNIMAIDSTFWVAVSFFYFVED